MNSVGDVSDGHFVRRPLWEEGFKEMPADFPMQATHAIHGPASPDREIGHVETLRQVVWILAAQGQQIVDCNAKLILRIPAKVLFDKSRRETVKAGGDGGVGGEQVSCPRGG